MTAFVDPHVHDGPLFVSERLVAAMREDLGRADTKASMLLSGTIAVLALVHPANGFSGTRAGQPWQTWLLWAAAALWGCGIVALVIAVLPRTGSGAPTHRVTYFGHVTNEPNEKLLSSRLTKAGRDPLGWLAAQAQDINVILTAKYRWIRIGACCLGGGGLLALGGIPW